MGRKSPDATDIYVGQRLRARRMEQRLSQEKLGDALKLTFQQVQKYEKGANRLSASRLQQVAHVLKVPVFYFFDGGPNSKANGGSLAPNGSSVATTFLATAEGMRIARALPQLEPKDRRAVVALIEALAG